MQTGKALGETLRAKPPRPITDGRRYDIFVHEGVKGQRIQSLWNVTADVLRETQEKYKHSSTPAQVLYRDISERLCKGIHPGD